jgi:hypothetical protein
VCFKFQVTNSGRRGRVVVLCRFSPLLCKISINRSHSRLTSTGMPRTISISAPAPASLALEALAVLLEIKVSVSTNETNVKSPKMSVQETHPLTSLTSTLEIKGWLPCIKHLCLHSVLWGDSPLTQAQVEAWILAGEAHLLQPGTL